MYTVSNNIETSRLNSYTCPHSLSPLASKAQIPQRTVEITLKKLASLASIRLHGVVMAPSRKTRHDNTVTSRQYDRRAIFVSGDVRFQDGDAVDLGKDLLSFFLSMSALALPYFAIRYTCRTTVLLWCNGLYDIRVLCMDDTCQCV